MKVGEGRLMNSWLLKLAKLTLFVNEENGRFIFNDLKQGSS